MAKYVELRKHLNTKANNFVLLSKVTSMIESENDYYRSVYYGDSQLKKYVDDNKSVKGYRGPVGADRIFFDFDSKSLEKAQLDCCECAERLGCEFDLEADEILVSFSGGKGFSLEISTVGIEPIDGLIDEKVPEIVRAFALQIAGDLGTFDPTIYSHNHIIRLAGTKHQKTGLYKTNIPLQEMLFWGSIKEIKKYSRDVQKPIRLKHIEKPKKLSKFLSDWEKFVPPARDLTAIIDIDFDPSDMPSAATCPEGQEVCIWRLQQGCCTEYRNDSLLRLACYERDRGVSPLVVKSMLNGIVEIMHSRNPNKNPVEEWEIDTVVKQAFEKNYSYGCNDPLLKKYCSEHFCYRCSERKTDEVLRPFHLVHERFVDFVNNIEKNVIPTGIQAIDDNMKLFRGTMLTIAGRSSVGKTSLVLNILRASNKNNSNAVFFSLDMTEELVYWKALQQISGFGCDKVLEKITKDKAFANKMEKAMEAEFGNTIITVPRITAPTVEEVYEYISTWEEKTGKKADFAIIDYGGRLTSGKADNYSNDTYNAKRLSGVAKALNLCICVVSQVSRQYGGEGDTPIGQSAAKGSGSWEEESQNLITVWRPFLNVAKVNDEVKDNILALSLAKNRMGPNKIFYFHWESLTGHIRTMKASEEDEFLAVEELMPCNARPKFGRQND